jgi:hypothetical protein
MHASRAAGRAFGGPRRRGCARRAASGDEDSVEVKRSLAGERRPKFSRGWGGCRRASQVGSRILHRLGSAAPNRTGGARLSRRQRIMEDAMPRARSTGCTTSHVRGRPRATTPSTARRWGSARQGHGELRPPDVYHLYYGGPAGARRARPGPRSPSASARGVGARDGRGGRDAVRGAAGELGRLGRAAGRAGVRCGARSGSGRLARLRGAGRRGLGAGGAGRPARALGEVVPAAMAVRGFRA